jgi:hypothetical protein
MITKFKEHSEYGIMYITDLARVAAKTKELEESIVKEILSNAFRRSGNQGVIDLFKGITGVDIEDLGNGRYVFKK